MSPESPPESMSRAELVAEVRESREQVRQMQTDMAFVKKALTALTDADLGDEMGVTRLPDAAAETRAEIEDVQSAVTSHGETLASIADVGKETTSKDEKIGSIVAYAEQACPPGQDKVIVTAKEIRGQTGVSRRYAYDLIDDIGGLDESANGGSFEDGRFEWAAVRTATDVPTSNGRERKPKALKIDFGRVHTDRGSVNKFTTQPEGEQGR